MKTIAITSKTSMNVPDRFTMAELVEANPGSKYPTMNARVEKLIESGEVVIENQTIKAKSGRGRVSIVYALKEHSLNSVTVPVLSVTSETEHSEADETVECSIDEVLPDVVSAGE